MDKYQRSIQANHVFTPGYPVSQKDLFAGRMEQLQRVLDTLNSPGRHPVLFGQRGVGKTSLANILGQVLKTLLSVKVSCDGTDTFSTVAYKASSCPGRFPDSTECALSEHEKHAYTT